MVEKEKNKKNSKINKWKENACSNVFTHYMEVNGGSGLIIIHGRKICLKKNKKNKRSW